MTTFADLTALEAALGHRFQRRELLELAVTHSSFAHENEPKDVPATAGVRDNEQLEFLGDAILGFTTSQLLFTEFPDYREGQLSKLRAHLVSEKNLVRAARELDLGAYLRLGKGEVRTGGREKATLLADAFEAVLAALFLDAGMAAALDLVRVHVVAPEVAGMKESGTEQRVADFKSTLQETLQSSGKPQPNYVVTDEEGPDHHKLFTVEVRILAKPGAEPEFIASATGPTKKQAEQSAAQKALEHVRGLSASN